MACLVVFWFYNAWRLERDLCREWKRHAKLLGEANRETFWREKFEGVIVASCVTDGLRCLHGSRP